MTSNPTRPEARTRAIRALLLLGAVSVVLRSGATLARAIVIQGQLLTERDESTWLERVVDIIKLCRLHLWMHTNPEWGLMCLLVAAGFAALYFKTLGQGWKVSCMG